MFAAECPADVHQWEGIMEETKKEAGRSRVYSEDSRKYVQAMELRRHEHAEQKNGGRFREPILSEKEPVRRKEQENSQKLHILTAILGVLVIALVVALIYEVILGNAVRETGSERMEAVKQEAYMNCDNDSEPLEKTEYLEDDIWMTEI
jgi:hypothetical protein